MTEQEYATAIKIPKGRNNSVHMYSPRVEDSIVQHFSYNERFDESTHRPLEQLKAEDSSKALLYL